MPNILLSLRCFTSSLCCASCHCRSMQHMPLSERLDVPSSIIKTPPIGEFGRKWMHLSVGRGCGEVVAVGGWVAEVGPRAAIDSGGRGTKKFTGQGGDDHFIPISPWRRRARLNTCLVLKEILESPSSRGGILISNKFITCNLQTSDESSFIRTE